MDKKFNFTKKDLAGLPVAVGTRATDYHDLQVRGLLLRVTDKGAKSFYLRRKMHGQSERIFIGQFSGTTIEMARSKAFELQITIARGEDPQDTRRQAKQEPTHGELLEQYLVGYAREHCLAAREIEAVYRRYLTDWSDRKISSIKRSDVQQKVAYIGKENGIVAANHAITYARAAINWCIANGYTAVANPWVGISKYKTVSRDRFLKPEELVRFFSALALMNNDNGMRDYICMLLYTGARRTNVMEMRWEQIDFDLGIWVIPRTKNGDSQTVPLTNDAAAILQHRFDSRTSEDWVFPSKGKTGHLVETKWAWQSLISAAKIENLRLHDLRRTLGSYMAMGNQSLYVIGKVLGHKSPNSTQIYSHFTSDPLRQAMEKAHADMKQAAKAVELRMQDNLATG